MCTGTACHVRNSQSILERLERDLHVERGHTSADREITLETVNCVGACALGPVVLVDGKHYGHLTVGEVEKLVEVIRRVPVLAAALTRGLWQRPEEEKDEADRQSEGTRTS